MKKQYKIVDLTHPLNNTTRSWNGHVGFTMTTILDYRHQVEDVKFRVQRLKMNAGIGTHMDAPAHCIMNGMTIDQIPLESLIAPCVVIDVSAKAHAQYVVSLDDIHYFQAKHGSLQPGIVVLIHTGWDQWWDNPQKYKNDHRFPSVDAAVAQYLLEVGVVGLGVDTLSPDLPEQGFPVHHILLNGGTYIIENVANMRMLPPVGAHIVVMPLRIEGATEAPLRLIGMIPRGDED